ncbi:MAG: GAP family protein [Actinobacteria bacterium]|nr:GAP family protein [Actinomycetota bacterium]
MWSLLALVVPLGIAAAITPTLIALQLLVVAGGGRWRSRSLAVVVANAIAFGIVIALVTFGLAKLPDAGTGGGGGIDAAIRIGAGVVLALSSVWFFLPHAAMAERVRVSLESRQAHASIWVFFVLAFYFGITDLSSFIVLLPALHDITASAIAIEEKAVVWAVVLFLALQATMLPPLVRLAGGQRVVPGLKRSYGWVMRNQFPIVGVVCAAVGVFLGVTGIVRLG